MGILMVYYYSQHNNWAVSVSDCMAAVFPANNAICYLANAQQQSPQN